MVERAKILFPLSQIGAITEEQRKGINNASKIAGKYDTAINRESAAEKIIRQREQALAAEEKEAAEREEAEAKQKVTKQQKPSKKASKSILATVATTAITYFAKTFATQLARNITKKSTTKKKTATRKKR